MRTPNITENKFWDAESVREMCIRHRLYTCGDSEEYEHMLNWVSRLYPNTENLYFIAKDIKEHSEDQTISNVMFILHKEAVTTVFDIEEEK